MSETIDLAADISWAKPYLQWCRGGQELSLAGPEFGWQHRIVYDIPLDAGDLILQTDLEVAQSKALEWARSTSQQNITVNQLRALTVLWHLFGEWLLTCKPFAHDGPELRSQYIARQRCPQLNKLLRMLR